MNAVARLRRAALPFAAAGVPCLAQAAEGGAPTVSSAASLAQAGLGLFGVIALILGLAWAARRAGLVRNGPQGMMKVIGSSMLGARQRLVLVEVGDTWLVLGVSAGEIRTLHSMPAGQATPSAPSGPGGQNPGGSFAEKLLRSMQENFKS